MWGARNLLSSIQMWSTDGAISKVLSTKGEGVKDLLNPVNVVYGCPLKSAPDKKASSILYRLHFLQVYFQKMESD